MKHLLVLVLVLVLGLLRKSARSSFHIQVDFCSHSLIILFSHQGIDQSFATVGVWKQRGDTGSPLQLLVQSLQATGCSQAHRMSLGQTDDE
jgi:hypothetical protein